MLLLQHKEVAETMFNTGETLKIMGDLHGAISWLRQALKIIEVGLRFGSCCLLAISVYRVRIIDCFIRISLRVLAAFVYRVASRPPRA
jgi:hypothetical protein